MVSTAVSREEICKGFSELGIDLSSQNVIDKLLELCQKYNKDAVSVADEWFAFITFTQLDSKPSEESLIRFENERIADHRKQSKTPRTPITTPRNRRYDANNSFENVDLLKAYGTPEAIESSHFVKKQRTSTGSAIGREERIESLSFSVSPKTASTFTASPIYVARSQTGEVVNTFGNIEIDWTNEKEDNKCGVNLFDEIAALSESYKYMFEKQRSVSICINSKIELMEDVHKQAHNIEEFAHLALLSAEEVDIVGQICCDGNGRLNPSSVLIEGSHRTSAGNIAVLDVTHVPSFTFFPGQVAALQAVKGSDQSWLANRMYPAVFPPLPQTSFKFIDRKENLSFIIAAGPFTTLDSLSYKPLEDLLAKVALLKPNICILIGPFVDSKRKDEGESCDASYDQLFERCLKIITDCSNNIFTQFVIVSSSNDAHHDCIYPTPPFKHEKLKNVSFVSDPSMMEFDGVVFGITATDILFHLGKEEITYPPGTPDRLGRLASHLLLQRSFYPLYPPSESVNVNLQKLQLHAHMTVTPHFLILPSDLSSFIKNINGCCCINPRRLTCGNDGGTYVHIVISNDPIEAGTTLVPNISAKVLRI